MRLILAIVLDGRVHPVVDNLQEYDLDKPIALACVTNDLKNAVNRLKLTTRPQDTQEPKP